MSEREKMRSGEAFDGRDPEIIALRDRGQTLLRELNQYKAGDGRHSEICAELFEQLGPAVSFRPRFAANSAVTSASALTATSTSTSLCWMSAPSSSVTT